MLYAGPVLFPITSNYTLGRVQRMQIAGRRIASGSFQMNSISHLYTECAMLPVANFFRSLSLSLSLSLSNMLAVPVQRSSSQTFHALCCNCILGLYGKPFDSGLGRLFGTFLQMVPSHLSSIATHFGPSMQEQSMHP